MSSKPLYVPQDRGLAIPDGWIVKTAYVAVENVILGNKARMAVGDVEEAYRKRLALGSFQPWPCPNGQWDGDRFVIYDGRHEYVATLMLGHSHILVAWTEQA